MTRLRRQSTGCVALVAAVVALALPTVVTAQEAPPNVVVVFTDDHATQAVGAYGSPLVQALAARGLGSPTPNLDGLAAEGRPLPERLRHERDLRAEPGRPSDWHA